MQTALREFDFLPDIGYNNYVLDHGFLWELRASSTLMCAVRCASFKSCISFYFNNGERRCRGYETLMLTTEAGVYQNNWNYFYLTDIGKYYMETNTDYLKCLLQQVQGWSFRFFLLSRI